MRLLEKKEAREELSDSALIYAVVVGVVFVVFLFAGPLGELASSGSRLTDASPTIHGPPGRLE